MNWNISRPLKLDSVLKDTVELQFKMASTDLMGTLLRTLVAAKPGGAFLEIGAGTGVGTCWLLDGMDCSSSLIAIEIDPNRSAVINKHLGDDSRLTLVSGDALTFLEANHKSFDLIFADFRPGKFVRLDLALNALNSGGIYIVDDLLPQSTWPVDHPTRIESFCSELKARGDLHVTYLPFDSGIIIASKKSSNTQE